jgi:hypothetical protein
VFVFANCDAVVFEDGKRLQVVRDQIWDAGDPFVKARPDLFSTEPRKVNRTVPAMGNVVESATAAPGEKRSTRRG